MKIWVKLLIFGIILFFAGIAFIMVVGVSFGQNGFYGIVISAVGFFIAVIAVLTGLRRGFRRMERE